METYARREGRVYDRAGRGGVDRSTAQGVDICGPDCGDDLDDDLDWGSREGAGN